MTGEPDPIYIAARKVLLDALDALAPHRESLILVGAQAVYIHVGEADLAVAPYTTDGDLALDPRDLEPDPRIDEAMSLAGFRLEPPPGAWRSKSNIQIDLLVPEAVGGSGRRGARLGEHGAAVARKTRGLEAALVDKATHVIVALDPTDRREHRLAVAGPASLLVAKLHKLAERRADPKRLKPKDALDVLRLLRGVSTESLAATLKDLSQHAIAGQVTAEAMTHLQTLFGSAQALGSQLAAQAVEGLDDPDVIATSCAALAEELMGAYGGLTSR